VESIGTNSEQVNVNYKTNLGVIRTWIDFTIIAESYFLETCKYLNGVLSFIWPLSRDILTHGKTVDTGHNYQIECKYFQGQSRPWETEGSLWLNGTVLGCKFDLRIQLSGVQSRALISDPGLIKKYQQSLKYQPKQLVLLFGPIW